MILGCDTSPGAERLILPHGFAWYSFDNAKMTDSEVISIGFVDSNWDKTYIGCKRMTY